jgi:hypothetical protein
VVYTPSLSSAVEYSQTPISITINTSLTKKEKKKKKKKKEKESKAKSKPSKTITQRSLEHQKPQYDTIFLPGKKQKKDKYSNRKVEEVEV